MPAYAAALDDDPDQDRLTDVLRRKYGMEFRAVMAVERLSRPRGNDRVILRIAPASAPDPVPNYA